MLEFENRTSPPFAMRCGDKNNRHNSTKIQRAAADFAAELRIPQLILIEPLLLLRHLHSGKKIEELMMNEISELLQQRFGLSADQAQEAERAILSLIKSKVPVQFQGMVDSLLGQGGGDGTTAASTTEAGGLLSAAEGLFGVHNG